MDELFKEDLEIIRDEYTRRQLKITFDELNKPVIWCVCRKTSSEESFCDDEDTVICLTLNLEDAIKVAWDFQDWASQNEPSLEFVVREKKLYTSAEDALWEVGALSDEEVERRLTHFDEHIAHKYRIQGER